MAKIKFGTIIFIYILIFETHATMVKAVMGVEGWPCYPPRESEDSCALLNSQLLHRSRSNFKKSPGIKQSPDDGSKA